MKKYFAIILILGVLACVGGCSVESSEKPDTSPKVELLWPNGAPGAKGDTENDKPTLTIYLPSKAKAIGTAVVICPGGAYSGLSMDKEGRKVAEWLNSLGIAGVVLKYRHRGTGYGHPAPLQDAQRAIRTVRNKAGQWNIDSDKIGIIGFSAGGHLASSAGTHFEQSFYSPKDDIDSVSARPDFMILVYPVITLTKPYGHLGSTINLLGRKPDENLIEALSNEKQVTKRTPPTFLVHGSDDATVPVENSVLFYLALRKAGVPAEMHIYEHGRHGFGLNRDVGPVINWTQRCTEWLSTRDLYTK